jgi:parallel beta-helix repeat protein
MNSKLVVTLCFFCLIASALITALSVDAASKTLTVPDDYSTINAALESAIDGDTIIVKSGTYTEHLVIDKAVTLKGAGSDSTTINGDNSGTVLVIKHDSVEVSGFTITYDETPNSPKSLWMWSTRLAGIHLLNVKNCNIHDNKILDCGGAIWLYGSQQNRITNNYVNRNDYGIRVENSNNNTIQANTAIGNWAGISLFSSIQNNLGSNSMSGNTQNFAVTGDNPSFINYVDHSNTVDSKPIYYYISKSHQTIPSDAGCVILLDCTDVTVTGLSLSKNHDGIIIVNCLNIAVSNNNIAQTNGGVITRDSKGGSITGNTINCINAINAAGDGCNISGNNIIATNIGVGTEGNYNTITANTVTLTAWQGNMVDCKGSYNSITDNWFNGTSYVYSRMEGSNNLFYKNTMVNSYQINVNSSDSLIAKNTITGITVTGGTGSIICGNKITDGLGLSVGGHNNQYYANEVSNNYYVGVNFYGNEKTSSDNTIYHNNFISNRIEVKNIGKNEANFWDNGAQGNYWSNYHGTDTNFDGIGDTPYIIMTEALDEAQHKMVPTATGQDNYPLIAPFDITSVTVDLPHWVYAVPEGLTPTASLNSIQNSEDSQSIEESTNSQPTTIQPEPEQNSKPTHEAIEDQTADQPNQNESPTNYTIIAAAIIAGLTIMAALIFIKKP